MKKQKAAVLFSGGKDSCLALHMAKKKFEISYLLSVIPKNFDSFMFHKPDLKLVEKQAEMLDIGLVIMESEGRKEEEVEDLRKLIEKVREKVDVIVAGGIASSYQGKRIKEICSELSLKFYAPLWDYKEEDVWSKLLDGGFKVVLTKISCEGIGREWLGRVVDEERFMELKELSERHGFRVDFEGGEAETAVLFMPGFKREVRIKYEIKSDEEYRHFLKIKQIG